MDRVDRAVREAAQEWYVLATEGRVEAGDVFFRFVAVYVALIALLTNKYTWRERGSEVQDWERINWFAEEANAQHEELLANTEYREAVDRLAAKRIFNMQKDRPGPSLRNKENLEQVLGCVRTVRNNIFHGGKEIDNARDKGLVKASYVIVSKLVEPYLSDR